MFEKVNPKHPDKIADRIAGAIVDLAYKKQDNPKIAVEVLVGHGKCSVIEESNVKLEVDKVYNAICRICETDKIDISYNRYKQDKHLANNQAEKVRCGDNGIFKGAPITKEQSDLTNIARRIYSKYESDGKYILHDKNLIICQSSISELTNVNYDVELDDIITNPLGKWTGGINVDTGATNRKLGSDMGDAITGGGLHGKDLSKADVSVNIYAHLTAQRIGEPINLYCAIGDENIDGIPYAEIVKKARTYIYMLGGFEKFAEWGLIR